MDKKPTYTDRIAAGGVGGGLAGLLSGKNPGKAAMLGSLGGLASNAIGYGIDEDPVGGGALSGGLFGAGTGVALAGTNPKGGPLLRSLIQKGMSKKSALALLLGYPAAVFGAGGAAIGAGMGALEDD